MPHPWVTYLLILINIGVAFELKTSPLVPSAEQLMSAATLDPIQIWNGEGHRFFTAMFIHGTWWHLIINMWALLQVGSLVEELLGSVHMLMLYLLSGIFGFTCSVLTFAHTPLLTHPGISVGASGAVFGLVGALLVWALLERHQEIAGDILRSLPPFVVLTLVLGFGLSFFGFPVFDNSAHVGGLLAGALLGLGFFIDEVPPHFDENADPLLFAKKLRRNRLIGTFSLVLLTSLVAGSFTYSMKPSGSDIYHARMGWNLLVLGDAPGAQKELDEALSRDSLDVETLWLKARLDSKTDKKGARKQYLHIMRALAKEPSDAVNRAYAQLNLGRIDGQALAGICDAALHALGKKTDHSVLNSCAWHLLDAADESVHQPERALQLSRRAFAAITDKNGELQEDIDKELGGAYLHTLAMAQARTGDFAEAEAKLERILAQGWGKSYFSSEQVALYNKDLQKIRLQRAQADAMADHGDAKLDALRKEEIQRKAKLARRQADEKRASSTEFSNLALSDAGVVEQNTGAGDVE
ncbi:MAG: rhomboid family intramembrane serine protease [Deltaproteobacteria bacterium]|nr:rhomboid family intramembrane serine protease [Deltaproteobacteria bacterium]